MKKILSACLLLGTVLSAYSAVVINEFQTSNTTTQKDPDFQQYSDWIELYNNGTEAVDLSSYYVSDKKADSTKWSFPAGTKIAAGAYLLVWADDSKDVKNTIALHANFTLNTRGEEIALYNNKILIDSYTFGVVPENVSIGRSTSDASLWQQYSQPTPQAANTSIGAATAVQQAVMSVTSGFYTSTQSVAISSPTAGAKIYYTTNGTTPSTASQLYSKPIQIAHNTVLKAIVIKENYLPSRVVSQTYFINERAITIPVVSIGVDSLQMFDKTTGMYMMGPNASQGMPNYGANFWEDRELPATFEYFVNGKEKVQVNTGLSIHGGYSRRFDQRSFAINCSSSFGGERMEYQFFKSKNIDNFKTIILKNAGSDVQELKYRDAMINTLAHANMSLDYQAYQPSAVFINGQYWGILNVREKITENYLKNNYGLDSSEVDLLYNYKEVYAGTPDAFNDMFEGLNNAVINDAKYQELSSIIDIDEFIEYQIAEIYVGNYDWPGNNIRYWRKKSGGKWRWILYDTDQSFDYYDFSRVTFNSMDFATTTTYIGWAANPNSTRLLRKLLENTTFKNLFIQRFAAHINSTFSSDSVNAVVSRIEATLAGEKPEHLKRWGAKDSVWNAQLAGVLDYAKRRPDLMRGFIKSKFRITDTCMLQFKAINNTSPLFKLSGVNLRGNNLKGVYFRGIPFTLEAVNDVHVKFVKWQDEKGKQISTERIITVTPQAAATYVAVYEAQTGLQNVFINEVMASNTKTIRDENGKFADWIELYNANDFPIDIAGCYLTDNFETPKKFLFKAGAKNETAIPAKGYLIVWLDSDTTDGVLHANFKLSADGESIGLSTIVDGKVQWIDSLSFKAQKEDKSFGRATDGSAGFVNLLRPTPGLSNKTQQTTADELETENIVRVSPTVVKDQLFIHQSLNANIEVQVYSLLGEQVLPTHIINERITAVDVSALRAGYYLVHLRSGNTFWDTKIVVY